MAKRESNTSSLEDTIKRLLKVYKLSDKMIEIDVVKAWPEVMGPLIASKTEEVLLKKSVLIVRLNSSTLRQELSYGKSRIIENMNNHLGHNHIKDVQLK